MTVNRTTLLDLPLPVTGTESGTWGDTTNNGLTQYLDIAIAGTLVLSTDADVTLTSTEGDSSATNIGATTAQYAILRWTATGSTTRNITALAQSKTYVVINATGGTQSIVLRGAGPTTGVTIISGEKAHCVWNGSDFVKVSSSAAAGGSNTQVQYNSSGVLAGSSNLTFDGTSLTLGGNPTLSAGTANGVLYLNGSKVATSGSALTFDGSTFSVAGEVRANATFRSSDGTNIGIFGSNVLASGVIGVTSSNNIPLAFGVAATEQMRLTSTGLGIGTSSPASKLDVKGRVTLSGVGTSEVYTSDASGMYLTAATSGGMYVASDNYFIFRKASSPYTEYMRLDSSGNLGIGTSSPQAKLQVLNTIKVSTSDQSSGNVILGDGSSTSFNVGIARWNGSTNAAGAGGMGYFSQGAGNSGGHYFYTGDAAAGSTTLRMTIDTSGNLGLGVTPSAWAFTNAIQLPSSGALSGNANTISLSSNWVAESGGNKYINTAHATVYQQTSGEHRWFNAPSGTAGNAITFTQAMTLSAAGGLSIGNTGDAGQGNISVGGTGANFVNIRSASGSGQCLIFTESNVADRWLLGSPAGSGDLVFRSNAYNFSTGTERARITSGGNFKIGGTADRGTTEGDKQLVLFNGTAPVGTLTNGISLYSSSGEAYVMDAAGNATLFSPHDRDTNEWIFRSKHTPSGKVLKIDVERLLRFVNDHFGLDAVQEFIEP